MRGFILDMDGTVYLSERALPGAVETIAALRRRGLAVAFVSNKPLEPGSAYAARLTRLGIPTARVPLMAARFPIAPASSRRWK